MTAESQKSSGMCEMPFREMPLPNIDRAISHSPPRCPDIDQEAPDEDEAAGGLSYQKHYVTGGIEAIEVIEEFKLNYRLGNVIKYILRHQSKDGRKDLCKALNYLYREITGVWMEELPPY